MLQNYFLLNFSMIDKLMQLVTQGDFIIFSCYESFKLSLHCRALTVQNALQLICDYRI
jgi:hypothetical protein